MDKVIELLQAYRDTGNEKFYLKAKKLIRLLSLKVPINREPGGDA